MKTIYICWTDEFTNKKHAALWLFSGNDDDVFKAQEYVGNIGGNTLPPMFDHNKNWYDTTVELD